MTRNTFKCWRLLLLLISSETQCWIPAFIINLYTLATHVYVIACICLFNQTNVPWDFSCSQLGDFDPPRLEPLSLSSVLCSGFLIRLSASRVAAMILTRHLDLSIYKWKELRGLKHSRHWIDLVKKYGFLTGAWFWPFIVNHTSH